ncbi:MFS transporter [Undibacterium fentianense]|uniref:MFS transporter n=1 Tax=Undibacterium fentianense TaxID=2828728 RepID=A0A941E011_9BURK|nr:MFS transporter [Undibacterium fentianense]MBR7799880.1 MFS transporter [Undibacterium fentianense]
MSSLTADTRLNLQPNSFKQDAMVISLVGLAHAISHFFHMILAPLFPWLKDAFNLSYAELGLLMSAFFVVSGIGQALAGFVVDRVGARAVLFFGIACLALSAAVLAIAPNYAVLMLGSMLAGLGNSVFHPADYTILNQCVTTQRLSHAFSVHGISGNLGWAAAPVFLVSIAHWMNWRIALMAAAVLPLIVLAILLMHRQLLSTRQNTEPPKATLDRETNKSNSGEQSLFHFMRLPAVWMCFLFFFMISMGIGGIQSFSPTALREVYGMSLSWATAAYTAYMLTSAVGMIWGGFIAAKANDHDKTITIAFSFSALMALFLASGWLSASMAVVLMGAVGLGAGIAGPSRDLLIRAAAPKNATGRVYGVVYSGLDIGLAFSPALFGALMDAHHPNWVFAGIGIFQLCAIFTAVGVGTNTRARQK